MKIQVLGIIPWPAIKEASMDSNRGQPMAEIIEHLSYQYEEVSRSAGPNRISREVCHYFEVGVYLGPGEFSRRIVFPVHDRQCQAVGYAAWVPEGDSYVYPVGFARDNYLFNLHRVMQSTRIKQSGRIIIVEDVLSCIALHGAGYPNTVALMGTEMSEAQEQQL